MSSQSCVNPGQELARLTLIGPTNEAAIRRRSIMSPGAPRGLGEIDGAPVLGPQAPPASVVEDRSEQPEEYGSDTADFGDEDDYRMSGVSGSNDTSTHTQPASLSLPDDEGYVTFTPPSHDPPNFPPPVPPRPTQEEDRRKQLLEEVEIGAQQDVTEVINNVLFQSQCAIKPRGVDDDGEQLDQIKE